MGLNLKLAKRAPKTAQSQDAPVAISIGPADQIIRFREWRVHSGAHSTSFRSSPTSFRVGHRGPRGGQKDWHPLQKTILFSTEITRNK